MGGENTSGSKVNTIDTAFYSSGGKFSDFGDLTISPQHNTGTSNSLRGLAAGGEVPSQSNTIDYVTMSSAGNAIDFIVVLSNGLANAVLIMVLSYFITVDQKNIDRFIISLFGFR